MKVSLNWLSDHLDLSSYTTAELDDLLTFAGVEVEGIEDTGVDIDHLVVAEVLSSDKHPDADKLSVCQVNDGSGKPRQIVCGAKNYKAGDKVPLALPGCELGGGFKIKEGKLRGVPSLGMLCSASELGLEAESDGLLILSPDATPGQPIRELFDRDVIFDLEITPNRPDLLSHLGMARELAALSGKELKGVKDHTGSETPVKTAESSEIRIEDEAVCPFYTGRWIRGVKIGPSPEWLADKLRAIGLRPINNVVDITNYVLMEMGQPLHAFDLAKLDGGIVVRPAKEGETFLALDEETYTLKAGDLVIADQSKAVALGGVMGGEDSGVTDETTDILLESAYFNPSAIRRTARRLVLHSDSSYRFERGVDPAQIIGASDLATRLIVELAGGTPDKELVVCGEAPSNPVPVSLDPNHCRRLMGHHVKDSEIDGILSSLGLSKLDGNEWEIPSYRRDLERPADLIEEVARVYGLEKIPSTIQAWFSSPSKTDGDYDFSRTLKLRLSGMGLHEAVTLKLISDNQLADGLGVAGKGLSPVRVKNPLNDEQSILRPSLIPGLLASAERNLRMGNADLRLFEIGRVFSATPKGQEIEKDHLGVVMTGYGQPTTWHQTKPAALDIFDLRGVLEALCPGEDLVLAPVENEGLILAAEVSLGKGAKAGVAGILTPARARDLGLEAPVFVAELDLKKLASVLRKTVRFEELPRFPAVTRDVAIEAPMDLDNGKVVQFLRTRQEPLLTDFSLVSVFSDPSGEKIAADRKSLAYSLTYRSAEKTLASGEVDGAHRKILEALKKELPVEFR